jgi:trk system potassium uptake protein TrkH
MRPQIIIRYIGITLLFNAIFLFISAAISAYKLDAGLLPLLYSAVVVALIGIFPILFVPPAYDIRSDEGLVIVIFSWLLSPLIGTFPYVLYGGEFTFTNAWFESVSGFTTTGSTILNNIEALPLGLLFWRSTTHFIGGIGIIIFMLAVVPSISQAAMVLYKSEVSGLAVDNFQYRTKKTLQIILVVYVGLVLLETVTLMLLGLDLFDAVTHAFATIATGGFSPKNNSLAFYDSPAVEMAVIVFMVLSGLHFGLIFVAMTGNIQKIWKSSIARYYVLAMALGVILVSIDVHGDIYPSWSDALRYASFQLVSLGTSTGFATADSSIWPPFSILVLIFFTLQCACAGSTSGGIKVDRIIIFCKSIGYQFRRLKHPRAVFAMKVDNSFLDQQIIAASNLYIAVYLGVVFLSGLVLTFMGVDIMSAFSGSAAAMGNVGPGFNLVSSLGNFSQIPAAGKWVLSFVMLLGRLEIYSFLMLLIFRFIR